MSHATVPLEDAVSFKELKKQPLYAARIKIHPKDIHGTFRKIKWTVLVVLLGIYYLVPWIRWDRGPGAPDQAVLIDMPARRAYFFWIEIWPQEIYFLTLLMILAAFGLFWVTAMFGRVWCGYTCPQTVWTDLFMWVERRIEGDRGARIRLDKAPWTAEKVRKRGLKHGVWLLIAFLTGGAWIMYFNDAPTVVREFFTGEAGVAVYFFVGLFTATTYLLAGWAREQVCVYMCPWPRFQGALLDEDTYVVTYQNWRGEPRAPLRKNTDWEQRGDCIACHNCVAVCPTGIDIRDGLQLECIGCGLCIDACNDVMDRIGRPRELITLDTARNQQRLARGQGRVQRLIRRRTVMYAAIFTVFGLGILIALGARASVDVNVLHDRSPLFVTLADGSIRNGYTIKILNKSREPRTYTLGVGGVEGAELSVLGQEGVSGDRIRLEARPDAVTTYRVGVTVPEDALDEPVNDIEVVLDQVGGGERAVNETVFRGPG
ncbi:MAG TPA: cytochrome c oxidase accessory protein CcoG [Geminicoccaceae bacterium]